MSFTKYVQQTTHTYTHKTISRITNEPYPEELSDANVPARKQQVYRELGLDSRRATRRADTAPVASPSCSKRDPDRRLAGLPGRCSGDDECIAGLAGGEGVAAGRVCSADRHTAGWGASGNTR